MRSWNRHHLVPSGAIALIGALLLPAMAGAQTAPPGEIGARDAVRLSWNEPGLGAVRHDGVVVDAGPDAILLETSEGVRTVPVEALTLVEYGRPRTPREGFKHGFKIGGILGGLGGMVVGVATGAACDGDIMCPGPAGGAAILGVVFGLGGGVVGGMIKAASPGIEWRDAPVRATAAPAPGGGATVGLRVSF